MRGEYVSITEKLNNESAQECINSSGGCRNSQLMSVGIDGESIGG